MYHLIVEWLGRGSAIVDLLLKDYRKAFDLIRHSVAITNLRTMGAHKHILLLVINFLQARYQCVYRLFLGDTDSKWVELTCRAPQGTKVASLLFLAEINIILSGYEERLKYVDDLSVLLKYIVEKSEVVPQFCNEIINNFKDECTANSRQINEGKTKILRFNPLKRDFVCTPPPYPSESLTVVLGVKFSINCSFGHHANTIIKKANSAMRTPILMCLFGFSVSQLRIAYLTYIRRILEYACPVWGPKVKNTIYLSDQLASIQERAVKVIFCNAFTEYKLALSTLQIPSLQKRRLSLILESDQYLLRSDKHRLILPPVLVKHRSTRSKNIDRLAAPPSRINRFSDSFISFFVSKYNHS
ncbi:uncharacterized protein LOC136043664 [Artemia franciscana]|uniref:uncharacterized protein LOC136043664 n=1 Tax=Artemia franciscana TaxID=6661 RepID=UPI0032DA4CDA